MKMTIEESAIRDTFAANAVAGVLPLLAYFNPKTSFSAIAEDAFALADAMIAHRRTTLQNVCIGCGDSVFDGSLCYACKEAQPAEVTER